ncbi:MAG: C10 family peptidase [Bacteroidales bacterium]|nr:C10 family peptidase [Bacteroidales bacterium]
MKKLGIILSLLLLAAMPLMAERVTPKTAQKVAMTFLSNNGAKASQLVDLSKKAGFANLYIFNGEEGFVVISADDRVQPILGYSLTGTFKTEGMPENIRWWLQGYSDQIQGAIENQLKATTETAQQWKELRDGKPNAAKRTPIVGPLIQTKWDQGSPYNNLCPESSVTGCVATAMAQVMKYWDYPTQGIGSHSYIPYTHPEYGELTADFYATTYDWNNMTNTYGGSSTEAEKLAVATLMYHCGISVDMDYSPSSSGAVTAYVADALKTYFNYSSDAKFLSRSDYDDDTWISKLKADLDSSRPIQYSGRGDGGGHSFVFDGYSDENYFHVNWGWGGYCDDYYLITNLNPGPGGIGSGSNGIYNDNQGAILGIHPSTAGAVEAPTLTATLNESGDTKRIELSWTSVTNAASYKLYYNTNLLYSETETSYVHENITYGTHTYFVRSVDANGNLSIPSNYETINLIFPAPTNLTVTPNGNGRTLSWTAALNCVSYNVYCNHILVATGVTSTNYTDNRPVAGTLDYYVKGVDSSNQESDPSSVVSYNVNYSTPIVDDVSAQLASGNASLTWSAPKWCYPNTTSDIMTYGSGDMSGTLGYNGTRTMYWGHRYPASSLTSHVGKNVYQISFYVAEYGKYQCLIYKGTENSRPKELVSNTTVSASIAGWFDIDLAEPIQIDDQDLWVFLFDPESKKYPAAMRALANNTEGNYYTSGDPLSYSLYHYDNSAWLIETHLTDGTYTYNLYDGTTKLNDTPITGTSYTHENPASNTTHQYTVKTNYYGGETDASNMIGFTLGSASIEGLTLEDDDEMILTSGSTLTVSGNLVNNGTASHLIIEEGAQLIHPNSAANATLMKSINAYDPQSSVNDGWYTIASPVNALNVDIATVGTFDLYAYDEPDELWLNQKNENNNLIKFSEGTGYLYANATAQVLAFAGNMKATSATISVPLSYASSGSLKGFNLVGNPFTRKLKAGDITLGGTALSTYYVVEGGSQLEARNIAEAEIKPGQGFLVMATEANQELVFNPSSKDETNTEPAYIRLEAGNENFIDHAYLQIGQGNILRKMTLTDQTSQISLRHDDADYAAITLENDFGEQPVSFKAAANGTYTITVETKHLETDYLHLIDNLTGNNIDLLQTPSYRFEAKTSDYPSRFRLVFNANHDEEEDLFAFISNGNIVFTVDNPDAKLQVVDILGRVVANGNASTTLSTAKMAPGVYVLRMIDGNNIKTQKITLKP